MTELSNYKEHLRETILDFKEKYDLCDDGVNEFLEVMGLQKLKVEMEFTFTIRVSIDNDDSTGHHERKIEQIINDALMEKYIRLGEATECQEYDLVSLDCTGEV